MPSTSVTFCGAAAGAAARRAGVGNSRVTAAIAMKAATPVRWMNFLVMAGPACCLNSCYGWDTTPQRRSSELFRCTSAHRRLAGLECGDGFARRPGAVVIGPEAGQQRALSL